MAFYQALECLRILMPENPNLWWTLKFPSVTVTSFIKINKHYIKFLIIKFCLVQKTTTKHKLENVTVLKLLDRSFLAFILTTFYRLYVQWCILNACSLYFVLSLFTQDSDWTGRGILLFTFSYLSVVLYTTIMKMWTLETFLSIQLKIRSVGAFVGAKQEQNTHVFDTTTRQENGILNKMRTEKDDLRVPVHMPGWVNLLPIAILAQGPYCLVRSNSSHCAERST